jgi:hypothetical protein
MVVARYTTAFGYGRAVRVEHNKLVRDHIHRAWRIRRTAAA